MKHSVFLVTEKRTKYVWKYKSVINNRGSKKSDLLGDAKKEGIFRENICVGVRRDKPYWLIAFLQMRVSRLRTVTPHPTKAMLLREPCLVR